MNRRNERNDDPRVEIILRLPSGQNCNVRTLRTIYGADLIHHMVEQGVIEAGSYEFVSKWGRCMHPYQLLDVLFSPGETMTRAELRRMEDDGSDPVDIPPQVLYGCPTAVTAQQELLRDCKVTKILL